MIKERAMEILGRAYREHYDEACEIGRKAILKQIAQKLKYEGDSYDNDGKLIYGIAYCPVCNREFEYENNGWGSAYCSDCGQALDWSVDSDV